MTNIIIQLKLVNRIDLVVLKSFAIKLNHMAWFNIVNIVVSVYTCVGDFWVYNKQQNLTYFISFQEVTYKQQRRNITQSRTNCQEECSALKRTTLSQRKKTGMPIQYSSSVSMQRTISIQLVSIEPQHIGVSMPVLQINLHPGSTKENHLNCFFNVKK